jgi:hypothetical protein
MEARDYNIIQCRKDAIFMSDNYVKDTHTLMFNIYY